MSQTIAGMFYEALQHGLPDALAAKSGGTFKPLSHADIQERVERIVLAFEALGLKPGDRIALLSENRPAWAMTDYACAIFGLVSVPIYHTATPEQVHFVLRHSGCRWLCVSSKTLLGKMKSAIKHLPELETILFFEGPTAVCEDKALFTWEDLLQRGAALDHRRTEVQNWADSRTPDELLTIIYTSGTTGDPKGVMLSHGNLASNITCALEVMADALRLEEGDRCLSVLPISHIFERMAGHYAMFQAGVSIYYAESLISLPKNLLEVRPQIMMAVPRIFEKIYAKVRDVATGGGPLKRLLFRWAVGTCHSVVRHLYLGRRPPFFLRVPWLVADRLLLSKVREKTGGRLRCSISGGAALNPRVAEFFWAMGIPIYEGYGLTETSPILAANRPGRVRPGYVGSPLMKTWDGKPFLCLAPDGEILAHGPNVMLGYWRDEKATREVFSEDGYFLTGDIGELDPQGRLKITDRKKELIVTSGGKNIAPQPIENRLREDEYIEQAVLVGDKQDALAAIIYPNMAALRLWASHHHLHFSSDAEMVAHPKIHAQVLARVNLVNDKLAAYERVRKVALLDQEMTVDSGLLTPSLKVKRRVVSQVYADLIESLYCSATRA